MPQSREKFQLEILKYGSSFAIDDLYLFFQKVLDDRDSEHGDSDQDISANGSPMTRKRGMWLP